MRHDGAAVHLRLDRLVDAQQGSGVRESGEEVVDRFGLFDRFQLAGDVGQHLLANCGPG